MSRIDVIASKDLGMRAGRRVGTCEVRGGEHEGSWRGSRAAGVELRGCRVLTPSSRASEVLSPPADAGWSVRSLARGSGASECVAAPAEAQRWLDFLGSAVFARAGMSS